MQNIQLAIRKFFQAVGISLLVHASAAIAEVIDDDHVSTPLIVSKIRFELGQKMAMQFIEKSGFQFMPSKGAKPDTYSDEEIKSIANEFEKIMRPLYEALDREVQSNPDKVQSLYAKSFRKRTKLNDQAAIKWANQNRDFMVEAMPLATYSILLWSLAPDKVSFPAVYPPKDFIPLSGDDNAGARYQIYLLLNSERITPILPNWVNVSRLRVSEREVRQGATTLRHQLLLSPFPDTPLHHTAYAILQSADITKDIGFAETEIKKLASKAKCLAQSSDNLQCK
jgi:hypothetical protein